MADFTALKTAIQNAIKQNGNEEITGNILQDVLLAIVSTLGDGSINDLVTALGTEATTRQQADGTLQQNIEAEATTRGNADTTLQQNINAEAQARQLADSTLQGGINTVSAAITAINNAIGNGCVYAGIATPSSTPASGKVFYLALTAGTYTNYGGLEVSQGINILKNNGSTWSLDAFVGIDDTPTPSSNNLVKSGGVFNDIMTNGSAFDLTAYNNGTTYADLNAALTALNALPAAYKKGGMSIKFVQSSDNKYVQYRFLLSGSFTTTQFTNVDNWSTVIIDRKPSLSADASHAISSSRYAIDFQGATDLQEIEFTSGYWIKTNGSTISPSSLNTESTYSCAVVPCVEGDIFIINGFSTTNARLWAFGDADNNNIMMSDAELTMINQTIVAPSNAAYIVINIQNIGQKVSYKGKRFVDKMPCHIVSNGQFKFALIDSDGKVIFGVDNNGNEISYTKHINTKSDISVLITKTQYGFVLTDINNKVILAIDKAGKVILNDVPKLIEDYISDKIRLNNVDIVYNNLDKEPALYAASYKTPFYSYSRLPNAGAYSALYKKKCVLAWGSDFHGDETAFQRFVEYINHYSDVIDGGILTGDMSTITPLDDGFKKTYAKYAPTSRKPILMTIGNHEVTGNTETLAILNSINESDSLFIQPYQTMYDNKGEGAYYYKDFTNPYSGFKFRVIILNDYEMPRIVAGGNWETIDYDDTLSTYDNSYNYSTGMKCNLDGYSYKALKNTVGNAPNRTYIYKITGRFISQEQADWLISTLNNTPTDYKIIICSHMALDSVVDYDNKFTARGSYNATSYAQNGFILTDILNAFINRTTLQQTYSLKEPTSSPSSGSTIEGYDVVVDADFSDAEADFYCSLSGHSHTDLTGKSQHLSTPSFVIGESGHLYNMDDLVRFGIKGLDCFNIISFDENGIDIIRIGCDITTAMEKRDYIRFNI